LVKTLKAKDINESDTIVVVTDILCDVFGLKNMERLPQNMPLKRLSVI